MNSKFGECCNCPALIDGRYFTNYQDRDALQFDIMKENNISNSNAFRNYLIANGTTIMSGNTQMLEKNYKCNYNNKMETPVTSIDSSKFIDGKYSEDLKDFKGGDYKANIQTQ